MLKLRRAYRVALVLLALCLLILIGLFVFTSIPNPAIIQDSVGEASILFETSDNTIFSEADCYTVRWDVQGINGVYLNDKGKTGQGEESLCYEDIQRPKLRVIFEDDTEETYKLAIVVVQQQPIFWVLIGLVGILLFFSFYFVIAPFLGVTLESRKSTVYAILNLIMLTTLTLVVVLGALEVGLRFYFTNYGTEDERISYVYSGDEIQEQTSRLTGVPYVLYVANPNYEGHNSLGYRGKETTLKKPADTFRIVTLGASTTYGFGVNANQAYPAVLQDVLQNDYGYTHVEVINGGVPGYTSFELLSNFQYRILELDPDLVIYYGGRNDADTRFEDPGCYNNPSPIYGLTTYYGLWRTNFDDLSPSTLYRYFAVNTGQMSIPNSIEFALADIPIAKECESDASYTDAELLELNQPVFAERNFRNLLVLAQFNDIEVVVSEFIHPTELSQVNDESTLLMPSIKKQGVAELNALYRTIAEEMNVHYYALSQDYVIEPDMFWTTIHMRPNGTEQQAQLYAQYLVENDLIPSVIQLD